MCIQPIDMVRPRLRSKRNVWGIRGILVVVLCMVVMASSIVYQISHIKRETFDLDDPEENETSCEYVSSRGILKSCKIHSEQPVSSSDTLDDNIYDNETPNATLYVCNTAIREFIVNHTKMKSSYILYSGDSDDTISHDFFNDIQTEFDSFIHDERLIHWYCQNCVIKHPKITVIPIGMDYHTMHANSFYGEERKTPLQQETELKTIQKSMRPFWEREVTMYCNFQFLTYGVRYGYDRKDVIPALPSDYVYVEKNKTPRTESWKTQTNCAFVVSPHGLGMDCHRTWEALLLGCIVIVRKSEIDSLYDGLPVLIVDEWTDITSDLLRHTIHDFKQRPFNRDKLTLAYYTK